MPWRQQNENTHKMNKITKGLMVEKLGNLIACYSKKKKKSATLLARLSCRPPLIGESILAITARSLNNLPVNLNKVYLVLIK